MTLVKVLVPVISGGNAARWAGARLLPPGHRPPLDLPTHLRWRVAARHHACDEGLVLLFILRVALGKVGNHRQQIVGGREHALFDHFAELLVTRPYQLAAAVLVLSTQNVIDDFVPEILGIADARG